MATIIYLKVHPDLKACAQCTAIRLKSGIMAEKLLS